MKTLRRALVLVAAAACALGSAACSRSNAACEAAREDASVAAITYHGDINRGHIATMMAASLAGEGPNGEELIQRDERRVTTAGRTQDQLRIIRTALEAGELEPIPAAVEAIDAMGPPPGWEAARREIRRALAVCQ